uniref:Uncharacterized protein n=1 Tax=Rhizophora mucronata TaxID=61149 RepID=A0A2P2J1C4_RHIMU
MFNHDYCDVPKSPKKSLRRNLLIKNLYFYLQNLRF